jgi:hypothetical protein
MAWVDQCIFQMFTLNICFQSIRNDHANKHILIKIALKPFSQKPNIEIKNNLDWNGFRVVHFQDCVRQPIKNTV